MIKQKNTKNRPNRNTFTFEGGEDLTTMGASWFISYLYHTKIDSNHLNWERTQATNRRISVFRRTSNTFTSEGIAMHLHYVRKISQMSTRRLSTNRIGLSGEQVTAMAKELLKLL